MTKQKYDFGGGVIYTKVIIKIYLLMGMGCINSIDMFLQLHQYSSGSISDSMDLVCFYLGCWKCLTFLGDQPWCFALEEVIHDIA